MWEKLKNTITGTSEVLPDVPGATADTSASK